MSAPTKHVIKKYANRKLYDTQSSRYVTLEGISELLRQGHEIQVLERDTGRDLTPLILSQIVATEEKRGSENGNATIHERGQTLLGYVRRSLSVPAALVTGEVEKRRSELEDRVEGAVEQALLRLSIPTRRDVEQLSRRLEELERQIASLRKGTAPAKSRSRTRTSAPAR
jgi:PHB accumulation regulatory protein/poly(hydroxyalkanoate) granule associated protein phasin